MDIDFSAAELAQFVGKCDLIEQACAGVWREGDKYIDVAFGTKVAAKNRPEQRQLDHPESRAKSGNLCLRPSNPECVHSACHRVRVQLHAQSIAQRRGTCQCSAYFLVPATSVGRTNADTPEQAGAAEASSPSVQNAPRA